MITFFQKLTQFPKVSLRSNFHYSFWSKDYRIQNKGSLFDHIFTVLLKATGFRRCSQSLDFTQTSSTIGYASFEISVTSSEVKQKQPDKDFDTGSFYWEFFSCRPPQIKWDRWLMKGFLSWLVISNSQINVIKHRKIDFFHYMSPFKGLTASVS